MLVCCSSPPLSPQQERDPPWSLIGHLFFFFYGITPPFESMRNGYRVLSLRRFTALFFLSLVRVLPRSFLLDIMPREMLSSLNILSAYWLEIIRGFIPEQIRWCWRFRLVFFFSAVAGFPGRAALATFDRGEAENRLRHVRFPRRSGNRGLRIRWGYGDLQLSVPLWRPLSYYAGKRMSEPVISMYKRHCIFTWTYLTLEYSLKIQSVLDCSSCGKIEKRI